MLRFAFRRLLVMGPLVFVVLTVTFVMVQMAPGSPFSSQRRLPPEIEANLKAKYGFDQPKLTQYVRYMGRLVGFTYSRETKSWTWHPYPDFGDSTKYKDKTVNQIIKEALPVSAVLGLLAYVLAMLVGLTAGIRRSLQAEHLDRSSHHRPRDAGRFRSELRTGTDAGHRLQPDPLLAAAGAHGLGFRMGIPPHPYVANGPAAGGYALGGLHRLHRAAHPQRNGGDAAAGLHSNRARQGAYRNGASSWSTRCAEESFRW